MSTTPASSSIRIDLWITEVRDPALFKQLATYLDGTTARLRAHKIRRLLEIALGSIEHASQSAELSANSEIGAVKISEPVARSQQSRIQKHKAKRLTEPESTGLAAQMRQLDGVAMDFDM